MKFSARITPLPPVFPFAWAVAHGQDRFGLWQAFEVAGVRQRLRWVPPGNFEMGSPPGESYRGDDETLHPVTLSEGYWLADTAVSQALWLAVLGGDNPANFKDDPRCPVEQVSWADVAERFLPALNQLQAGLALRLPWEAEWEYACREAGAATGPFSFGKTLSTDQANYKGNYPYGKGPKGADRKRTVPVDALQPNALGLYNLHGNVWEWCGDWYAPYPARAQDPQGPPDGGATGGRVLRGGSWFFRARLARSALRFAYGPGERFGYVGFRLARGPLPEAGWAEPSVRLGA